ncbi:MAG: phosphopentomutase [Solirubrobacteraceae bacterium]
MTISEPRRAFVLVIDACGAGALPDAASYGDEGANTLVHLAEAVGGLRLPTLQRLGLGSIMPILGVAPAADPAVHGRLAPLGPGKDSITGHWELMGVSLPSPLPVYPEGFPAELLARLREATGRELICNRAENGLIAIEQWGAEHLRTGALIVYTSQDSVLQLAAHAERVAPQELYRACEAARAMLVGEHAVGRVIARPFEGRPGAFARMPGRRDYALVPPGRSYLELLQSAGAQVHAVGKVADLFGGRGIDGSHPGADNADALASVAALARELDGNPAALVFANLIETDQVYGHRKDVRGFAGALEQIDRAAGALVATLRAGDLLVVTADHGVDPAQSGTDHTREHVPLLACSGAMVAAAAEGGTLGGLRHDGAMADVGATALAWLTGTRTDTLPGEPFIS